MVGPIYAHSSRDAAVKTGALREVGAVIHVDAGDGKRIVAREIDFANGLVLSSGRTATAARRPAAGRRGLTRHLRQLHSRYRKSTSTLDMQVTQNSFPHSQEASEELGRELQSVFP